MRRALYRYWNSGHVAVLYWHAHAEWMRELLRNLQEQDQHRGDGG